MYSTLFSEKIRIHFKTLCQIFELIVFIIMIIIIMTIIASWNGHFHTTLSKTWQIRDQLSKRSILAIYNNSVQRHPLWLVIANATFNGIWMHFVSVILSTGSYVVNVEDLTLAVNDCLPTSNFTSTESSNISVTVPLKPFTRVSCLFYSNITGHLNFSPRCFGTKNLSKNILILHLWQCTILTYLAWLVLFCKWIDQWQNFLQKVALFVHYSK